MRKCQRKWKAFYTILLKTAILRIAEMVHILKLFIPADSELITSQATAYGYLAVKPTTKDLSRPRSFVVKLFQFQHIIRISDGQQCALRQPVWLLVLQPLIIVERTV